MLKMRGSGPFHVTTIFFDLGLDELAGGAVRWLSQLSRDQQRGGHS